jgi:hypothetical protein
MARADVAFAYRPIHVSTRMPCTRGTFQVHRYSVRVVRVIPKLENKEHMPTSSHASRFHGAQDLPKVTRLENPEKNQFKIS